MNDNSKSNGINTVGVQLATAQMGQEEKMSSDKTTFERGLKPLTNNPFAALAHVVPTTEDLARLEMPEEGDTNPDEDPIEKIEVSDEGMEARESVAPESVEDTDVLDEQEADTGDIVTEPPLRGEDLLAPGAELTSGGIGSDIAAEDPPAPVVVPKGAVACTDPREIVANPQGTYVRCWATDRLIPASLAVVVHFNGLKVLHRDATNQPIEDGANLFLLNHPPTEAIMAFAVLNEEDVQQDVLDEIERILSKKEVSGFRNSFHPLAQTLAMSLGKKTDGQREQRRLVVKAKDSPKPEPKRTERKPPSKEQVLAKPDTYTTCSRCPRWLPAKDLVVFERLELERLLKRQVVTPEDVYAFRMCIECRERLRTARIEHLVKTGKSPVEAAKYRVLTYSLVKALDALLSEENRAVKREVAAQVREENLKDLVEDFEFTPPEPLKAPVAMAARVVFDKEDRPRRKADDKRHGHGKKGKGEGYTHPRGDE